MISSTDFQRVFLSCWIRTFSGSNCSLVQWLKILRWNACTSSRPWESPSLSTAEYQGPPFTRCRVARVPNKKGAAATRWHCTSDSVKLFETMQHCMFLLLHWLYPKQCFTADDGSIRPNLRDLDRFTDFSKVSPDTSPHTLTANQTLLEVLALHIVFWMPKIIVWPSRFWGNRCKTVKHWPCPTTSR